MARQPNIQAAIRRSRTARAAKTSRARRWIALAAIVSTALAGGGFLALDSAMGGEAVEAAVAKTQSLADLIGQRSPGERTAAQLTKTRHVRALARARARPHADLPLPTELARVLMPPPNPQVSMDLAAAVPTPSFTMSPPVAGLIIPAPAGGGGGGIVAPPGGAGGISPPGQSETFRTEPRQPVTSAVPEPGSWALMLLGFGLIGWRARGRAGALRAA